MYTHRHRHRHVNNVIVSIIINHSNQMICSWAHAQAEASPCQRLHRPRLTKHRVIFILSLWRIAIALKQRRGMHQSFVHSVPWGCRIIPTESILSQVLTFQLFNLFTLQFNTAITESRVWVAVDVHRLFLTIFFF